MHVKNSHYFSHDSNARGDPKIMALISKYGMSGYGRYWVIVEILSEQSGYKLKYCNWSIEALALAMQHSVEEAKVFIDDCIENIELFKCDGEYFWSESLARRMKLKEQKVEQAKKAANARWSKEKEEDMQEQCVSNASAMRQHEGDKEGLTSQIKEKRSRYSSEQLKVIDEYFDILRWTRKNGKIADSVILKIYKEWEKHPVNRVIYALSVYVDNPKYHDKKENYCYGIMRNSTAEEVEGYKKEEPVPIYWRKPKENKKINDAVNKVAKNLGGD